ncbi:MAG: tetratricopeptide repeat protein [Candidatus Omnitrophica bacterium]|nr:tetratricopeptide repeat protein [Candidatus Omnitrophota bacterium]MDE2231752.1 tetratricopeptide repeat protein [Candidatus Omnitrophota bacterium]
MLLYRRHFAVMAMALSSLLAAAGPCLASWGSLGARSKALAQYILAVRDDMNDDAPQAIKEYQKASRYDPLAVAPRLKLAAYDLQLNRPDKAIAQLKAAARISPQDSQTHFMLAYVYFYQHKYDLAASQYETILKIAAHEAPAQPQAYLYLGELYYAEQKYGAAIGQFSKVLTLEPHNTSALYLLGCVYADTNDNLKAIEMFRKALRLEPGNSDALNSLGYIYAQQGTHLKEAVRLTSQAVKDDPSNGAYYDSLGWALYKEEKYPQALAILLKAEGLIENEVLYEHIGDVYKALRNDAMACRYWRKSLGLDPDQVSVQRKIKELRKCPISQSFHLQK